MKVKGTLGSVEQNNYAVGEQRERDTKGWSDSEANKLRSFPPTHIHAYCRQSADTVPVVLTVVQVTDAAYVYMYVFMYIY